MNTNQKEHTQTSINAVEGQVSGEFSNFPLSQQTIARLNRNGITSLFPIQANTFMSIYNKRDLIGKDRTGSGKTLAFILPVLERMRKDEVFAKNTFGQKPYVLCLVPTRELAN